MVVTIPLWQQQLLVRCVQFCIALRTPHCPQYEVDMDMNGSFGAAWDFYALEADFQELLHHYERDVKDGVKAGTQSLIPVRDEAGRFCVHEG